MAKIFDPENPEKFIEKTINDLEKRCSVGRYLLLSENIKKIKEYFISNEIPPKTLLDGLYTSFINDFLGIEYRKRHGFETDSYILDGSFEPLALDCIARFYIIFILETEKKPSRRHTDFLDFLNDEIEELFDKSNKYHAESLRDAYEIIQNENNFEKAARSIIPLYLNTYECLYKPNMMILKNMMKHCVPDLSQEGHSRTLEGMLCIYTTYKDQTKFISDYRYIRNSLAHSSYAIKEGSVFIYVKKNRKIINEIKIPCDDFIKWPYYLEKKINGFYMFAVIQNILSCYRCAEFNLKKKLSL